MVELATLLREKTKENQNVLRSIITFNFPNSFKDRDLRLLSLDWEVSDNYVLTVFAKYKDEEMIKGTCQYFSIVRNDGTTIYKETNVIDQDKGYSLEEIKQFCRNRLENGLKALANI